MKLIKSLNYKRKLMESSSEIISDKFNPDEVQNYSTLEMHRISVAPMLDVTNTH